MAPSYEMEKRWVRLETVPIVPPDEIHFAVTASGVIMSFGQIAVPVFIGTDEEQLQQAQAQKIVPIQPLARMLLQVKQIDAMIAALVDMRNQEAHGQARSEEDV